MGKPRRKFMPEFKQEAVDLLRRSGKTATQVARELGIGQTTLSRWTLQAAKMPLGSKGFLVTEELKAVRRELDQVRQERDILKKAIVGSSDQCNTIWGKVALEGDRDGIYGTSGLVRGPESGSVAAVETGAVIERDRPGTRQTRRIDSWRGVIERGIHSSCSEAVALGADIGGTRRDFSWHGDGVFDPADRGQARSNAVDRQPGNQPPWWSPHLSRR